MTGRTLSERVKLVKLAISGRYRLTREDISQPVHQAMALETGPSDAALVESPELQAFFAPAQSRSDLPTSRDLFSDNGTMLPCWLKSDAEADDGDWLTSPKQYPFYYAIFSLLAAQRNARRYLEIGVRTGYTGAVFAQAAEGRGTYTGVDPNLYLENGLELASATLKKLRSRLAGFEFSLIEGYSWEPWVQHSLSYSSPFDIIHIDGDHTLIGKLIDLDLSRRLVTTSGVVLVDDFDHHRAVIETAIRRSIALGWYKSFTYLPTMRGLGVLQTG